MHAAWTRALARYLRSEPDGPDGDWLTLRHPNGDFIQWNPDYPPSAEELDVLHGKGWRIDRPG